jgi:hypothetical protein
MPRGVIYFLGIAALVIIVMGYFGVGQLPWSH